MYVVCVEVRVKPEHVDDFVAASRANHEATRRDEPGNVRWDLLQQEDDRTRFVIYEVYRTKGDLSLHHQTSHYLRWRETVTDWMAEPRSTRRFRSVAPPDATFAG